MEENPCQAKSKRKIHVLTSELVIARAKPVAIQTAFPFALPFKKAEPPLGLPRRYAPRNDELEGERMNFAHVLR
ncbi:MAG: hypothetical protein LBB55_03370, partial [Zoogloeaceae bacterium]|nr:hypothetical protein [Zoogloeaceae bacterium]